MERRRRNQKKRREVPNCHRLNDQEKRKSPCSMKQSLLLSFLSLHPHSLRLWMEDLTEEHHAQILVSFLGWTLEDRFLPPFDRRVRLFLFASLDHRFLSIRQKMVEEHRKTIEHRENHQWRVFGTSGGRKTKTDQNSREDQHWKR